MGRFDVVEPQAEAVCPGRGFSVESLLHHFQTSCGYCFPFWFNSAFNFSFLTWFHSAANLWSFWGLSITFDLARIQQCLHWWIFPSPFMKGQGAQGGAERTQHSLWTSICSWQRFYYPQGFLVKHLRMWCPLKSLCQESAGAYFGERAPHGVGAGGACVQGCMLLPRAVFLSITLLVQKSVLEVPHQDTSSSLCIKAWFHSGNGISSQESTLHQRLFQTRGWLSETKTLPQS